MAHNSPLRYPGGKGKIADFFKLLLLENNLLDSVYVEVFAGGAGIALSLLFDEYVSIVYLNDLDPAIYAFWHSVIYETENLCRLIADKPVTIDEWNYQREVQKSPNGFSSLDLGFSTFFLNRTNRSGIINGGIIGGKNQKGEYKMNARFNRDNLITRIQRIARYESRLRLFNKDASDFIIEELPKISSKYLTYFDPPYFLKGSGLYQNYYQANDHRKIAGLIEELNEPWVVSYDNVPQIASLYSQYDSITYRLGYSTNKKYFGSEVMFFSDQLRVPSITEPTAVTKKTLKSISIP